MSVAFFEIIAVIYVYGFRRFIRDLEFMTGEQIGKYWIITWRFISPTIMFVLFTCSVIKSFKNAPQYLAYNSETVILFNLNFYTFRPLNTESIIQLGLFLLHFYW